MDVGQSTTLSATSQVEIFKHGAAAGLEVLIAEYVDGCDQSAMSTIAVKALEFLQSVADTWV